MTHQNSPSLLTRPTLMRSSGGRESHSEEPSDQAPTHPTRAEGQRLRSRMRRTSRDPATSVRRSFRQSVMPNAWPGTKPCGNTNPLLGLPFVCKNNEKINGLVHRWKGFDVYYACFIVSRIIKGSISRENFRKNIFDPVSINKRERKINRLFRKC